MSRTRISYSLIGLLFLLIGLMIAVGLLSQTGGLAGRKIVRAQDGLRVLVSMDWTVRVDQTGTMFSNNDEALGSPDPALGPRMFRALIISGRVEELPLPEGIGQSEVAIGLAGDEDHRGVSFRGSAPDGQTILIVREVAPDRYAGVFASAAPGPAFPHQRELEEIVKNLSYQAVDAGSKQDSIDFWVKHEQTVRMSDHEQPVRYDLLTPDDDADPPESGWPVLVLAHAATPEYASIARDGLAIIVKPELTWNTFEEDRRILDAVIEAVGAEYPVDDRRLILHGCSVGGQFAFEYSVAEPDRILGAVVMAGLDLNVPPEKAWQVPFVFFYGEFDPYYNAENRAAIESMQKKMNSVDLYLDAGQAHYCDATLGMEAIRALLMSDA